MLPLPVLAADVFVEIVEKLTFFQIIVAKIKGHNRIYLYLYRRINLWPAINPTIITR
jgi:hypothetical protein